MIQHKIVELKGDLDLLANQKHVSAILKISIKNVYYISMTTQFKDLVPRPITELPFADTYKMLLEFAEKLTGSEIGARYLVAALASKVMSICN